jgi:carbon starvation protein
VTTLAFGVRAALAARRSAVPTARETPHVALSTADH